MKRILAWILCVTLMMSAGSALALNYPENTGNEATFETLEEARKNGPDGVKDLENNVGATFVSHPVLDGYPEATTYVYRSANRYGGRAAGRLNTTILVFADQVFESKVDAKEYLEKLGLIRIIDEAIGSVVLVSPQTLRVPTSSGSTSGGYGDAEQKAYYALQTAMLSLDEGGVDADGQSVSYCDAEYFGGFGYWYLIGIGEGATFLNDYIAPVYDYISRVAGMLLIDGEMERVSQVAEFVPVYLVNAADDIVAKYKEANGAKAYIREGAMETWYNQDFPLRKVISVKAEEADRKAVIEDAYYNLFTKAMRIPVGPKGVHSAGTPYQGYGFDQAPYSLCERNLVVNGWTRDGIRVEMIHDNRFDYVKSADGEYLQCLVEYLPEEVVDGTAPDGSVPLILANHGGSDDPRLYVDEIGLLALAGQERIAIVAPEEQYISNELRAILPDFTRYILEKYPALDASRVYVTGYSMGGFATLNAVFGDGSLFAAAAPQAGAGREPDPENDVQYETIDLPIMICHSEYDLFFYVSPSTHDIVDLVMTDLHRFLAYNEMDDIEFDFDKYPISGFEGDRYEEKLLNGEHLNRSWFMLKDGVPMVGLNYTNDLQHALYPEYAKVIWNFLKHYSRDPQTLEISYNPYVD